MSPELSTATTKLPSAKKRLAVMALISLGLIGLAGLMLYIWFPRAPGGGEWAGSPQAKVTYNEQASKLPDALSSDFPQMPGAELKSTFIKDDLGRRNIWISWTTDDGPEVVIGFYQKALTDRYRITDSSANKDGTSTISFEALTDPDRNGRGAMDVWTEDDGSTSFTVSFDQPLP